MAGKGGDAFYSNAVVISTEDKPDFFHKHSFFFIKHKTVLSLLLILLLYRMLF